MGDRYSSFATLAQREKRDIDWRIQTRVRTSATLIIAPHGGGIERGTSELAEAVAYDDMSLYIFEGLKARGNQSLHLSSSRFDEPSCIAMLQNADRVVTIHGEHRDRDVLFLGGLDTAGRESMQASLQRSGFTVLPADKHHLEGLDPLNICNRGRTGVGIQIEIARGLRRALYASLSEGGVRSKTIRFHELVIAIREGIGAEA